MQHSGVRVIWYVDTLCVLLSEVLCWRFGRDFVHLRGRSGFPRCRKTISCVGPFLPVIVTSLRCCCVPYKPWDFPRELLLSLYRVGQFPLRRPLISSLACDCVCRNMGGRLSFLNVFVNRLALDGMEPENDKFTYVAPLTHTSQCC
jgi:hypothetical protein